MNFFTPFQQKLITIAAAALGLFAIWNILKLFLPNRTRTGFDRYINIGKAVFGALFAFEFFGLARWGKFFSDNPKRFFILPVTFGAMFLLVYLPALIRAKQLEQHLPKKEPNPIEDDPFIVRKATIFVWLLAAAIPGMLFSLYGTLFGPSGAMLLGGASFVLAISVFMLSEHRLGIQFRRNCPNGLIQRYSNFQFLNSLVPQLIRFFGICAVVSMITFIASIASAHWKGPDSLPIFELRGHYLFHNHASYTEVSRLRYLIAGTSFVVAWHSGAMITVLSAFYALIFGRIPPSLKRP